MIRNQKPTGRSRSVAAGLISGCTVSLIITMIGTALLAWLVNQGTVSWEKTGYGILTMLIIASFLGAYTACLCVKRQYLMISGLTGAAYFGLLMLITALFFGGQYQAVGTIAVLILGGCGASGMLCVQKGRGKKRVKWKNHYR